MGGMDTLDTFRALVRAAFPRIDYHATYFGKVVAWSKKDQTVDVTTTHRKLPGMAGVPFMHGLPGTVVDVVPGTSVAITWLNGDPSQPRASLWGGGETVVRLEMNAQQFVLNGFVTAGGAAGAEPPPKGVALNTALTTLTTALGAYAAGIAAIADPTTAATNTLTAAITAFQGELAAALATQVVVK